MSLSGPRLAARLARREVRHRPWRTLLVALLVAGPVAGMTMAVVLVRTDQLSPLEQWRLTNGRADAVLRSEDGAPAEVRLPPGSRALPHRTDYRLVRTSTGRQTSVRVTDLEVSHPLARGVVHFTGRAPERAGEVLVSEPTARKLGVGIGDRMTLERPIAAEVTVVGIGERADSVGQGLLVLHGDTTFPVRPGSLASQTYLVDLPDQLTPQQATAANRDGDVVWVLTGSAGAMALLLGVCAVAPGYVSVLGPAAARLGGTWRLAARSLARQRSRTGAVVAAVCASAALAVSASAIIQIDEVADDRTHLATDRVIVSSRARTPEAMPDGGGSFEEIHPAAPEVVAAMRKVLPDAEVFQQRWVDLGDAGRTAAVVDANLLETYGFGRDVRKALDGGGLVAVDQPGREVPISVPLPGREPRTLRVPVVPRARTAAALPPAFLITPRKVAELGLVPQRGDVILRQGRALTGDQRVAVDAAIEVYRDEQPLDTASGPGTSSFTFADLYLPPTGPDSLVLDAALGAIALVFTLFVVATSLALAAAETRDERDVLAVVGASPGTIRRTGGNKALVLSAFGVALAIPVGLLPVLLFTQVDPSAPPFVFPWRVVALLLVGIPLLAWLATTATSALALRLRPVRISTMAFE